MNLDEFIEKQREIQNYLLDFFDESIEYRDIIQQLEKYRLPKNRYELKLTLYFIINISNNHQRLPSFFTKIEAIIQFYRDDILSLFTNYEIFRIFRSNKRILLYVIQDKILIIDDYISSCLKNKPYINQKYLEYFSPEFDPKSTETDLFFQKRMNGENDAYICEMIRDDSIIEFIQYVNKANISLLSRILISPFETNAILLKKEPSLIEYSAFYGSIQIFRFLIQNNVQLTENIWDYAIHGRNADIIHLIEENEIEPTKKCIKNSIRCHHNEITEYFLNNYQDKFDEQDLYSSIKFYNFQYFPETFNNSELFYYLCKYDYYLFVENLLNIEENIIDINYKKPAKIIKKYKEQFYYPKSLSTLNATAKNCNIDILSLLLKQKKLQIEDFCFYKCKEILKISLPSGLTSFGKEAFYKCNLIKEIKIPSSVTSIENYAFYCCSSIKEIEIPSSVTFIGPYAFYGCSSLEQIKIPPSVQTIEVCSFQKCASLKSITIPSSVTCIKFGSFKECSSLTKIIIPSSVTSVENYAFARCSSVTQISIPTSLTKITIGSFQRLSSLKEIIIPSSITSIEDAAFYECSSLTEIKIPSSVKNIGYQAFKKCQKLEKVVFEDNFTLDCLDEYAFNFCSSLKEIAIPSSVTSIKRGCFAGCKSLSQILIPPSVKCIDEFAFNNCVSLEEIIILSSVEYIESFAFKNCVSLEEIRIPRSVKIIQSDAFFGCKSLIQAIILPSDAYIFKDAFPSHTLVIHFCSKKQSECKKKIYAYFECIHFHAYP